MAVEISLCALGNGAPVPVAPPMSETHKALMARVAATRDRAAFRALFDHFGPRIKAIMMKSGADSALAEDIVQDVMMTVWRKIDLYHPERGSASAWIFTIARNARINFLRKGVSRPYDDIDDVEIISDDPDGEAQAIASERAAMVGAAMTTLPDEQREIVHMAYVEDLSQTEIAAKLALPVGTVKSRMRLAYAKLRGQLEVVQ
mgnify:FL=1